MLLGAEGFSVATAAVAGAAGGIAAMKTRHRIVALAGVALLSCGGGIAIGQSLTHSGPLPVLARSVPRCEVVGRVIERAGGLGTLLDVTVPSCGGARGIAVVDGPLGEAGGTVAGSAWVLPLGGDGFDRARWNAGARVHLVGELRVVNPPTSPLLRLAARIRALLRDATATLPADRSGLLLGLTIGETEQLGAPIVEDFRRSGLAHLVAVSGSNVALVLGAVALLARGTSLRTRVVLCAVTLVLYVLVVGPDASVLRAAGMAALTLIAFARGRVADPLAALGVAIVAIVVFRPGIVFAAGFHLSVAATLGIILLARTLAHHVPGPRPVRVLLGATLGAQLAVAPVLVATFGEISLIAPVANLLAAPAVAVTTIAGLLAGITGGVVPQLTPFVVAVADGGARWILAVARFSAGVPGAAVSLPPWAAVVALGFAVAAARWARNVTAVMSFTWAVLDAEGMEIERTQSFVTKDDAEAWMGSEWASLLARGGESVVLYEDQRQHYRMGLREA